MHQIIFLGPPPLFFESLADHFLAGSRCSLQESFAQRCFSLIDEYAPGFSSSVIGYDMLTPPDLEREIGLTGALNP